MPRISRKCKNIIFRRVFVGGIVLVVLGHLLLGSLFTWTSYRPATNSYIEYFPDREWRDKDVRTILFWTPRFGYPYWDMKPDWDFHDCPVTSCRLTNDKAQLEEADVVLFHSRALWNNFMGIDMPPKRWPHQVWMYQNQEPLPHTFISLSKYPNTFNWTSTYRLDSDVPAPYSKLVRHEDMWRGWTEEEDPLVLLRGNSFPMSNTHRVNMTQFKRKVKPPTPTQDYHGEKTKLMAWTSSNCIDQRLRMRLVNSLSQYIPVDRYGKCGNMTLKCKNEFKCDRELGQYRFYLSLENSVCTDYVTEKFFLALQRNQIPVVFSEGVNYTKHAPPNSYIDAKDFDSIEHLARYIKKVDSDPDLYNSYFWWQQHYWVQHDLHKILFCNICHKLHDRSVGAQVYRDIDGWYNADLPNCPQFSVTGMASRFIKGNLLKYGVIS